MFQSQVLIEFHCCWVFLSLQKVDVTSKAVTEVLTRTIEYLQPNPGKHPQPDLHCQHPSGVPPIAQGERSLYNIREGGEFRNASLFGFGTAPTQWATGLCAFLPSTGNVLAQLM